MTNDTLILIVVRSHCLIETINRQICQTIGIDLLGQLIWRQLISDELLARWDV
jgi:hypothetical protein